MFLRKAAIRAVPKYAVVDAGFVDAVEQTLDAESEDLQGWLDRGFAELDRRHPAIGEWAAAALAETHDELVQSLGYFLTVVVYMTFREAFPRRLSDIDDAALHLAEGTLSADEELRENDPSEILDSDDVVAMGQPAVVAYVQHHVGEALEQAGEDISLEQLDRVYRAVLVLVITLSHAVMSPSGEVGPPREFLA